MSIGKLAAMGGLIAVVVLGTASIQRTSQFDVRGDAPPTLEAYEAMLAAHPYSTRPRLTAEQLRAIPKRDRPDLAVEQDFLRTMDPATGTIPIEQLIAANRRAEELKAAAAARGGEPLVTAAWEERGPNNVAGRTRALMFDPNDPAGRKVWAGGVAGGLWYNDDVTDPASSWIPVDDFWSNIAVNAIAYDPTDSQVMYAGTGEGYGNIDAVRGAGIFKSTDGGLTWTQLPSTQTSAFYYVQRLAVHHVTGDVYAATSAGVQRSQDGGGTWEVVLGGVGRDVEITSNGTIYASRIAAAFSSTTGDLNSWTQINTGANGFPNFAVQRIELATTSADPLVIYAVTQGAGAGAGGFYHSTDGGLNWTVRPLPVDADPGIGADFTRGQAWYDLSIAADPVNPNTVFVGGIDLFRSTTGGANWQQLSHWYGGFSFPEVHADQHAIAFKPGSSDEILFSHDGGVTYTANGTAAPPTLQTRNKNYNVTQFYAGAIAPDAGAHVMLAGAQDNGTQRYSAPGVNVTTEVRGGDGGFTFIDQTQASIAISSYVFNTFNKSTTGGTSFPTVLINDQGTGSFINPADYDDREDILYTYRNPTSIYRVSNVAAGVHTTSVLTLASSLGSSVTHVRVSPYSAPGTSTVYLGTLAGRIFRLENAHDTPVVTELTQPTGAGAISCIDFAGSEERILATRSNYGTSTVNVFESTDGGQTWVSKEGDLPDMPVRWALYHPLDPNAVILATEAGVWETEGFDAASPAWTPAPGFPTVSTHMLQYRISDGMVMAATHGRGSFTAPFRGFVIPAVEPGLDGTASTHRLSAASPNPFGERTRFTLALAEAQRVAVALHDLQGRRVRLLHEGPLSAGEPHPFEVDGRGLPSGTYVVAVEGERFRDRLRLTLVR
jgi:hypothetical protein